MPHEWLSVVHLPCVWDLPDDHLECIVGLTLASFFGWQASRVYSAPIASVHQGPLKRGFPTFEFGTSAFKASPIYPVGQLALGGLPGLFRPVLQFVVHRQ